MHCMDVRKDKTFHYVSGLPGTRSEVCLPLMIDETVIGVLDIQSDFLDGFHQNDLLVLQILADTVAAAIDNARLLQDVRAQSDKIQLVSEITLALSAILDFEKLL